MSDQQDDQQPDSGQTRRRMALAVVVVGCFGAIAWSVWPKPALDAECQPEGGLRCAEKTIEICENGKVVPGVPCVGGCTDDGGIARCLTEAGAETAPIGAVCKPGTAWCSHDAVSLLVCREGRLAVGATCPHGCIDQGVGRMVFCLDDKDGIRFAEGFPCPGFSRGSEPEHTCGPDSESLLVCKDGLLALDDSRRCRPCNQSRSGALTCEGSTPPGIAAPSNLPPAQSAKAP